MKKEISNIKVLGSGCPKCKKLLNLTQEAVNDLDLKIEVEYVSEIDKIISLGVMSTPALIINDNPVIVGRLPGVDEVRDSINKFL